MSPETSETSICHGMSVLFPLPETNFSGVRRKIYYLRGKRGHIDARNWKKKSQFFSKSLKNNSRVGPTKNFVGSVKIAWLYMLQVYSWTWDGFCSKAALSVVCGDTWLLWSQWENRNDPRGWAALNMGTSEQDKVCWLSCLLSNLWKCWVTGTLEEYIKCKVLKA